MEEDLQGDLLDLEDEVEMEIPRELSRREKLKEEATSEQHLRDHLPKNPFCNSCQVSNSIESLDAVVSRMGSDDESSGIPFALHAKDIEPPDSHGDIQLDPESWHAAWCTHGLVPNGNVAQHIARIEARIKEVKAYVPTPRTGPAQRTSRATATPRKGMVILLATTMVEKVARSMVSAEPRQWDDYSVPTTVPPVAGFAVTSCDSPLRHSPRRHVELSAEPRRLDLDSVVPVPPVVAGFAVTSCDLPLRHCPRLSDHSNNVEPNKPTATHRLFTDPNKWNTVRLEVSMIAGFIASPKGLVAQPTGDSAQPTDATLRNIAKPAALRPDHGPGDPGGGIDQPLRGSRQDLDGLHCKNTDSEHGMDTRGHMQPKGAYCNSRRVSGRPPFIPEQCWRETNYITCCRLNPCSYRWRLSGATRRGHATERPDEWHQESGGQWEAQGKAHLAGVGFERIPDWRRTNQHPIQELFSVVHVDDFELSCPQNELQVSWDLFSTLQPDAAQVLMGLLWKGRLHRLDLLRAMNHLAGYTTKSTRCVPSFEDNKPAQFEPHLLADPAFVGQPDPQRSASGLHVATREPATCFPSAGASIRQRTPKAEIVAKDAAKRMAKLPALLIWALLQWAAGLELYEEIRATTSVGTAGRKPTTNDKRRKLRVSIALLHVCITHPGKYLVYIATHRLFTDPNKWNTARLVVSMKDKSELAQLSTSFTLHAYESDLIGRKSTPNELFEYVAAPSAQRRGGITDHVRKTTRNPRESREANDICDDLANRLDNFPLRKEGGKFEPAADDNDTSSAASEDTLAAARLGPSRSGVLARGTRAA